MGLPAIAPYPMPTEPELPKNRVEWTPDPDRAVLLVHDMQNHFLRAFPSGSQPMLDLVANLRELRSVCRRLGVPVVFSAQPGGQTAEQRGLQLDMWGRGIGQDPADAQIVTDLRPGGSDRLMTKWRYNAFHRTELETLMGGRDQLIITGVYAHIGCLMTATDAFMRDIQPFLVADAVADFSAEDHAMALRYAATRCATTLTTARLITHLTQDRP
ncbi:isochorismatase family protein [Actinokineospora globicatena]|uniref:Isochorismatase-like domain-containing protein n=1 Tax=Actinokineospora globicatena TaxID=103729 RepID=A0A9W6QRY5_9PSEU|nr:isochorismatase family protein [Actinokineospora globicatena]GLW93504.1 hypothetical protein Aglo03_43200 [Actinokineospora globicatena]